MKKLFGILAVVLALSMMMSVACAQSVRFEGDQRTFTVVNVEDGTEFEVTADSFILLGATDDGMVEIYVNDTLAFVNQEELVKLAPEFGMIEIPVLSQIETLRGGSNREVVREFQQALFDLGYLTSEPDGLFGNQSRQAVSAFQELMGIPMTGEGDPVTRQLVHALTTGELSLADVVTDSERVADLVARCEVADMSPLLSLPLTVEYDDITATSFIAVGDPFTVTKDDGSDLENYEFTVQFGFITTEEEGVVTFKPRTRVVFTAVRQPLLQKIYLKSGELRNNRGVTSTVSTVSGSKSVETCLFLYVAASADVLSQVAQAGELQVRLAGKYENYDFNLPAEMLPVIEGYGKVVAQLLANL